MRWERQKTEPKDLLMIECDCVGRVWGAVGGEEKKNHG